MRPLRPGTRWRRLTLRRAPRKVDFAPLVTACLPTPTVRRLQMTVAVAQGETTRRGLGMTPGQHVRVVAAAE